MKKIRFSIYMIAAVLLFAGCKKYLDYQPKGSLPADQLTTPAAVEGLATAAYAGIANDWFDAPITSLMVWGSLRSDDAYKGGGGLNDNQMWDKYEQFYLLNSSNNGAGDFGFPGAWIRLYGAISRVNTALRALQGASDAAFPNKQVRMGEMLFLRGHLYFILKTMFRNIPYIDDKVTADEILKISNVELNNDELWKKIENDFETAIPLLPPTQSEPGRANQYAAKAYLAKCYLYHGYTQDDQYNVTGVDLALMQKVVDLTTEVMAGPYALYDDYAYNFLDGHDNGVESIFAYQFSINDGTKIGGRLAMANSVNYFAGNPLYGCCGFHIPSQNLVNAFKTDANGLPQPLTFNIGEMKDSADFWTNSVDPRIDHTVAIAGHPFKYDPGMPYEHSWERDGGTYGGFGTMKELQLPTCACFKKLGPFYGTTVNIDVIRLADVILWQAEAQIQLGNYAAALPLINMVRARAANISPLVKKSNGQYPSNYKIDIYKPGVNVPVWDKTTAWTALVWERRMEFAMEGFRFFDLVRWGTAAETMNGFFEVEKTRHNFLANAHFTKNQHEYFPIPQSQITLSNNLYVQNRGY
jgi:hypothetical protein